MARPGNGGPTCESCASIDVRRWHREGRLHAGQCFSYSWTCGGEPAGGIEVRTEADAVVLVFRSRSSPDSEWKSVEQRVSITWTACHLGSRRAWFRCTVSSGGQYCGRRVALLYGAGELFACRRCYGLAYASQRAIPRDRNLAQARKIRARLGGDANVLNPIPLKPSGMHRRTYERLKQRHDRACNAAMAGLAACVKRIEGQLARNRKRQKTT